MCARECVVNVHTCNDLREGGGCVCVRSCMRVCVWGGGLFVHAGGCMRACQTSSSLWAPPNVPCSRLAPRQCHSCGPCGSNDPHCTRCRSRAPCHGSPLHTWELARLPERHERHAERQGQRCAEYEAAGLKACMGQPGGVAFRCAAPTNGVSAHASCRGGRTSCWKTPPSKGGATPSESHARLPRALGARTAPGGARLLQPPHSRRAQDHHRFPTEDREASKPPARSVSSPATTSIFLSLYSSTKRSMVY